jgi:hypothetical protein
MSNFDIFTPSGINNIMGLFSEWEKEKNRKIVGITFNDGYYGVPIVNIPFKYCRIDFVDKHYKCLNDDSCDVYDKTGKILFSCTNYDYLGYDMFLVRQSKSEGYSLYCNDEKLTDPIFKDHSSSKFNNKGYCTCGLIDEFSAKIIINKKGEILFKSTKFSYINLHGIIFNIDNEWYNIETLEKIADYCYERLEINDFLFLKIESNCVLQVNKDTGDIIIHGEMPKPKEEIKKEITIKEPEIKIPKQNRNDKCVCGSGKKYKNCCLNKDE